MRKEFKPGTVFKRKRSRSRTDTCTVVDILKTYNKDGELVQTRYVAIHQFGGQSIWDRDICHTTIAMNLCYDPDGQAA